MVPKLSRLCDNRYISISLIWYKDNWLYLDFCLTASINLRLLQKFVYQVYFSPLPAQHKSCLLHQWVSINHMQPLWISPICSTFLQAWHETHCMASKGGHLASLLSILYLLGRRYWYCHNRWIPGLDRWWMRLHMSQGHMAFDWRADTKSHGPVHVRGQPWDHLDNLVGFTSSSVPTDPWSPRSIVPFPLVQVSIIVLHSYIW